MKKNIILTAVLAVVLSSCNFLERYPEGGTLRQDQYEKLDNQMEGSVRGLYAKLYTMGGDNHDEFGKRSIDLWGDLLCSDIALTGKTYGWLYRDEQMLTMSAHTGTIWGHYYSLMHNINATILALRNGMGLPAEEDALQSYYGFIQNEEETPTYTAKDSTNAVYLAQTVGLRGYVYAQLAKWYTPVMGSTYMKGYTIKDYKCCPIYTEMNMDAAQPLSPSAQVYQRAFADMEFAIYLYENFGTDYLRPNKLTLDREVVCGLLAQAYLNASVFYNCSECQEEDIYQAYLQNAIDNAQKVISSGKYKMVGNSELLTNGFNNVSDPSWIWGQKVTVETSGGLKSWFGQVDIHSYSYAWAGDTKVIDLELFNMIPLWDKRKQWFNDGSKNSAYINCPDKKFFSAQNPESTHEDYIDRDWLSDNVFMRYESMYLIDAEANYRLGNTGPAIASLTAITAERQDTSYFMWKEEYDSFLAGLNTDAGLKNAIIYNWRIEMWGEGYGLETFRRWGEGRKRGQNHDYNKGGSFAPKDDNMNMNIPTSESTYNPNIKNEKANS